MNTLPIAGLTLAFLSFSLPGSAQVLALDAKFDQDTVGEPPALDLPGDPEGDFLTVQTEAGSLYVADAVGAMLNQPLVIERSDFGVISVTAHLVPELITCNSYLVRWVGMVDQEVDFFEVSFRSGMDNQLGQLQYGTGLVLSMNGVQNPLSVGYQAIIPQVFALTVDLLSETTSLSIGGEPVPEAQNLPFLEVNSTGSFENIIFSGGGAEFMDFVLDDLEVFAFCEPTATVPTTWSTLKTRYP